MAGDRPSKETTEISVEGIDVEKVVQQGIDRKTGDRLDAGLTGDVLAVRDDRMDRNVEPVRDLSETRAADYRNRMIGFIFQSYNLISFKTAVENVELPLFYQGVSRRKRHDMAMEYLDRLGLADWATHYPNEMSGGQKQRVAIARALITRPRIVLADEPTGALDSRTSVEIMELLQRLNREEGMTIIVVTHESGVANATNKIIHIKDGVIGAVEENADHASSPFGTATIMK